MGRIVVGIDGSEGARRALAWALEEGRLRGDTVEVIHAWLPPTYDPYLPVPVDSSVFRDAAERAFNDMIDAAGIDAGSPAVVRRLVLGGAASTLLDAASGADLVVVGSRGHGGFAGLLLGSVSQQVLHHATCPVVVVPAHHD